MAGDFSIVSCRAQRCSSEEPISTNGGDKKLAKPSKADVARVQSTQAKKEGGGDRGFVSRIQSTAAKAESKS